jgi:hypothetical protein
MITHRTHGIEGHPFTKLIALSSAIIRGCHIFTLLPFPDSSQRRKRAKMRDQTVIHSALPSFP